MNIAIVTPIIKARLTLFDSIAKHYVKIHRKGEVMRRDRNSQGRSCDRMDQCAICVAILIAAPSYI